MVYAPLGRTGVYPLQSAFRRLLAGDAPREKVRLARQVLDTLPPTNWFLKNTLLGDHRASDAGLYDLLLHARDRPYRVAELAAALERAGLAATGWLEPARYDPLRYLPDAPEIRERVAALDPLARMALAEELAGNFKTHVLYAARRGEAKVAAPTSPEDVPHLRGVPPVALGREIARRGRLKITVDGLDFRVEIPRECAPLAAAIDGRRSLGEIARAAGLDWLAFAARWRGLWEALAGFNLIHLSRGARR